MKYTKLLFFVSILMGALISLPTHAQWTFDERGRSELDLLIDSLGDRLYNQSEWNGGGKNGEDYETIIKEHVDQLKILLQKDNPPINHQDNDGMTPLMRAAHCSSWEVIELLIQAGADTSITRTYNKKELSALDFLALTTWARTSIGFIINMVMSRYNTKERYNKCVDLLTTNIIKRVWYKRWVPDEYGRYFFR